MSREFSPELIKGIAEALGLPPDADIEAINVALDELLERSSVEEVDGAIAAGAIAAAHRQVWLNSYKSDRSGTRAALAKRRSSSAVVKPIRPAAVRPAAATTRRDGALSDQEANDALWRLGVRAGLTPPERTISYSLTNEDGTPFSSKS